MIKRIGLLVMVALVAVMMMVATAAPAFAAERKCGPDRTQNQGFVCVKGGGQPFFSPRGQA